MSDSKLVALTVNGEQHDVAMPANRTLLEALRELGYVDVKCGCEKGDCGACAVLLDGEAIDSCMTLVWHADGREVTTVSGLGGIVNPHPVQKAFIENGAVQCGYCTPGMIIASKALLDECPNPSDEDIKRGLSGNLCRCTGYSKILSAVHDAAEVMGNKE